MNARLFLMAAIAASLSAMALAETPPPVAAYVYPAGARAGTTTECVVTGTNLQFSRDVRCSGGIVAKVLKTTTMPAVRDRTSQTITANSTVRLLLNVPASAPAGLADIRLVSDGGVSNRLRFDVGTLSEISEAEQNSKFGQAQPLGDLPLTINGQITEGDRDFFRFAARRGQKIVCRVTARTLLPYIADGVPGWNDVCMMVYNSAGREIATADDNGSNPDPVLMFTPPADGNYVLELRDVLMRGRGDFVYRLRIGQLPQITHAFPLGGRRGTDVKVALAGWNLPRDTFQATLQRAAAGIQAIRAGGECCNDIFLAASDYDEVLEKEDNDSPSQAQAIVCPTVVNGHIGRAGDVDCYSIMGEAGQKLLAEVQARRLGSPMDSIITLLGPDGNAVAENDDYNDVAAGMIAHQADSRILATLKTAGAYVLRVREVQGKGGDAYGYRLIVAPPRPDFYLRVMPDNLRCAPGDSAIVNVQAVRVDGFDRAIRIEVDQLPAGAVASPAIIWPNADRAALTITVPPDAAAGVVTPRIAGLARTDGGIVRRLAQPAEELTQAFSTRHVLPTAELALAVVEASPFRLSLVNPPAKPVELRFGEQVSFTVKATRPADSNNGVFFKLFERYPALNVNYNSIAPEANEMVVTISLRNRPPAGAQYNVILTGQMRVGRDQASRTLPAITLVVADSPASAPATRPASQPASRASTPPAARATSQPATRAASKPASAPATQPSRSNP